MRRFFCLLGLCALAATEPLATSACVDFTPPPVPPAAVRGEGSCMCSVCWTRPFCYDPSLPEAQQITAPPCAHPRDAAVPASRIVDTLAPKQDDFFCWVPVPGDVLSEPAKQCPMSDELRALRESFDPCVDAVECNRPPACSSPGAGSCRDEHQTARALSRCRKVPDASNDPALFAKDLQEGASLVVNDLVGVCSTHGVEPPSGARPERYCYLSCVNAFDCALDGVNPQWCRGC